MRSKSIELMNSFIEYIDEIYDSFARPPTTSEIASKFNLSHVCVWNYLQEMASKDMIKLTNGTRGIMTRKMEMKQNLEYIPIVGSISCGDTVFAEQNIEGYVAVTKGSLGSGKHYILKAFGNSMINAGINEGDHLFIRQQNTANEGEIVVARVDDEATLKRFYKDNKNNRIRLHPENDKLSDMYFDDINIQGIVVKVVRNAI